MASKDENLELQNISEAEAKVLVQNALAIKDLSKIKELAATNTIIHKVFAQLVEEMVGNGDQNASPSKVLPVSNQPREASQNGNQQATSSHGQLVTMLNASASNPVRPNNIDVMAQKRMLNTIPQQVQQPGQMAPIMQTQVRMPGTQQVRVQSAPHLRMVQQQGLQMSNVRGQQLVSRAPNMQNVRHLQPQQQQQQYVVMTQGVPGQQVVTQNVPFNQQTRAVTQPQTGVAQIQQFMIQTENQGVTMSQPVVQPSSQPNTTPLRKIAKRQRQTENAGVRVASPGFVQGAHNSFNLTGAMAVRTTAPVSQQVIIDNHVQQVQSVSTQQPVTQSTQNPKQLTAQQIQQIAIMKAQQIHKSSGVTPGNKQQVLPSSVTAQRFPVTSAPRMSTGVLTTAQPVRVPVAQLQHQQPQPQGMAKQVTGKKAGTKGQLNQQMTPQQYQQYQQQTLQSQHIQQQLQTQQQMPNQSMQNHQLQTPQTQSQEMQNRQLQNQQLQSQQFHNQQMQNQAQQQIHSQQQMQNQQVIVNQQCYTAQPNTSGQITYSQTPQRSGVKVAQSPHPTQIFNTPHQEAFLNFSKRSQNSPGMVVRTQTPMPGYPDVMAQQGSEPSRASNPMVSPMQGRPPSIATPQASQQQPVTMAMAGNPNAGPARSAQSLDSNTPNVTPLTSSQESMASAASVGQQSSNLIKDSEYLIQYSNGRKVIGVWDGKFFKIKTGANIGAAPQGGKTETVQNEPQLANATTSASQIVPNSSNSNLQRRALHELSAGQAAASPDLSTSDSSQSSEPKPAIKRPPRPREEGKFAICKNCGQASADYDICDSCKKPLPEDARLYAPDAATARKKPRVDPEDFLDPGISGEHPIAPRPPIKMREPGQIDPSGIDKKSFYGKNISSDSDAETSPSRGRGRGVRGARAGRGRGRAVPNRSPEIETVILSSDDEEHHVPGGAQNRAENPPNSSTASAPGTSGTGVTANANTPASTSHQQIPKRLRMEDEAGNVVLKKAAAEAKMKQLQQLQQQQLRKQEIQQQIASQDMSTVLVQLTARSIRVGSFRGQPTDSFKLTVQGVQFTIQWNTDCLQIHIGANEILSALCHFGEQMPCMFLQTTPGCAIRLREAMQMQDPSGTPYYDPSSDNEVNKYITVIFESLGESNQGIESYFLCIFAIMQNQNPLFKKGGQLLKEIDYQEANDLLINSTPHAQLQLMNLGLGGLLEGGEEDEPVDRSRSPSPPRIFTGKVIKLFTYPPAPAVGGINVTNEDLFCLNEGEFLNDVIIDFYLKYIFLQRLDDDMRKRTHIFSSFFYRRLTLKENKRNNDPNQTVQQRRHTRVRTWSRHFDIFEKDYVIVPINESAHWYLAIICFPGLQGPVYEDGGGTPSPTPSHSSSATPTPDQSNSQDGQKKNGETGEEDGGKRKDMLDDMNENSQSSQEGEKASTSKEKLEAPQAGRPRRILKQPCILVFDSLAGPSRTSVMRTLREYLQVEWDVKKKAAHGERVMDKDNLKGCSPRCPQQLNFSDCGVFVLQYVESFFCTPILDYTMPVPGLKEWFTEETALYKREDLRLLVMDLQRELNPSLDYDPAMDGIVISMDDEFDDLPESAMVAMNQQASGGVNPQQLQLALAAQQQQQQLTMATTGQQIIVATTNMGQQVAVNNMANQQQITVANQQVALANQQLAVAKRPTMTVALATPASQQQVVLANKATVATHSHLQRSSVNDSNVTSVSRAISAVNQVPRTASQTVQMSPAPQIKISNIVSGQTQFFSQTQDTPPSTPPVSSQPATPQSTSQGKSANATTNVQRIVAPTTAASVASPAPSSTPAQKTAQKQSSQNAPSSSTSGATVAPTSGSSSVSNQGPTRQANSEESVHNMVKNIVNTVLKQSATKSN